MGYTYAEWMWEWKMNDEIANEKIKESVNKHARKNIDKIRETRKIAARKYRAKQLEENPEEFLASRRDDVRRCRQRKKEELMKDPEAYAEFIRQRNEKLRAWRARKRAEKKAEEAAIAKREAENKKE